MREQILKQRAECALERLDAAKAHGDAIALADAKHAAALARDELRRTAAASGAGALADMQKALARPMTSFPGVAAAAGAIGKGARPRRSSRSLRDL